MLSRIKNLPVSVQIIGSVSLVLLAVGIGDVVLDVSRTNSLIQDNARKRGDAALDMLESVHVNAMLNRNQLADGDPAIDTLDGTMEQFSNQSAGVKLWLVMGPKVVAFQKAAGQDQVEGPKDVVDQQTIDQSAPQLVASADTLRITRPVILGQGSAADEKCGACHTAQMKIEPGEVIGAYSAAIDLAPEYARVSSETFSKIMYGLGAMAGALFLIFLLLRAAAIRPLRRLVVATRAIADGNLEAKALDEDRGDEIGELSRALTVFRNAAAHNRHLQEEAEAIRRQSEKEKALAQAKIEEEAASRLRAATSGLANGLRRLAAGDLDFQLTEPFPADFEALRVDFNQSIRQLGDTLATIADSVNAINESTLEIASGTDNLSRRTEQQAASLEQTAAAVEQITANVASSSKLAVEARGVATNANNDAARSEKIVDDAEAAMARIEESSGKISNIIGVIDEIAFQTNLLALNAGVEAARAGEAGKGFAVVAQEVRELAQRSANAAKEIKGLIQSSSTEVGHGVELVRSTGAALKAIGGSIALINQHVNAIATAAQEQATGLHEVNVAVNSMDQTTQQNAAMVEESNAASALLATEADKLRSLLSHFKLQASTSVAHVRQARPASVARGVTPARPATTARPQPMRAAPAVRGNLAVAPSTDNWEEF